MKKIFLYCLPFCLLYMKLASKFGARTMVGVGICVYMFICVFAFFMNSLWQFWMLAVLCATSQGGIQALSRSMYGKLIPDKDRSGEFFGFFDIFGRYASVMGTFLVSVVTSLTGNPSLGVLSIGVLLVVGFVLLVRLSRMAQAAA